MHEEDAQYRAKTPGFSVYRVAVILGAGGSLALASYMLALTPVWIALSAGALCGILGFSLGESIGDAIVFTIILGGLVFFFIRFGPETGIIRTAIVPSATGFCIGKVVYGIGKEVSS